MFRGYHSTVVCSSHMYCSLRATVWATVRATLRATIPLFLSIFPEKVEYFLLEILELYSMFQQMDIDYHLRHHKLDCYYALLLLTLLMSEKMQHLVMDYSKGLYLALNRWLNRIIFIWPSYPNLNQFYHPRGPIFRSVHPWPYLGKSFHYRNTYWSKVL